ncbi:MFS transporter [Alteromonas confluentis]|uniref:MFS transporter n=1 Tax=Alteromonas confluentis TaxID=1656094 RepID=UPI003CCBEA8A
MSALSCHLPASSLTPLPFWFLLPLRAKLSRCWKPRSLPFLCQAFFSCGIFAGGLMVLLWSALPDTIEYGLRETGVVNPTLTFGAFHMVIRVSDGLSFAVIAGVLEWSALQTAGNAE